MWICKKKKMKGICCHCGREYIVKNTGSYNRSKRLGLSVFCNKVCFGLSRRTNETEEEKRVYKQWYDLFIRASTTEDEYWMSVFHGALIFHMDYAANPEKYRKRRRDKQEAHNEYCRQPKYKEYKKGYDQNYRAKKDYGEYAEAAIALIKLEKEIDVRLAKRQNGIFNKSQKRKRLWQKVQAKQTISSLLAI